jgi:hypothetical protein
LHPKGSVRARAVPERPGGRRGQAPRRRPRNQARLVPSSGAPAARLARPCRPGRISLPHAVTWTVLGYGARGPQPPPIGAGVPHAPALEILSRDACAASLVPPVPSVAEAPNLTRPRPRLGVGCPRSRLSGTGVPQRPSAGGPSRGRGGPFSLCHAGLNRAGAVFPIHEQCGASTHAGPERDRVGGRSILLDRWVMVSSSFVSVCAWARTHAS